MTTRAIPATLLAPELSRAASLLHRISGRLRERLIDLGAFNDEVAQDFEDLARIATALESLSCADGTWVSVPGLRRGKG